MRVMVMVLVLLILSCVGCQAPFTDYRFVQQRFPELDVPERPTLESLSGQELRTLPQETRDKIEGNYDKLIDHSRRCEATIKVYNSFARQANKKSGFYSRIHPDKEDD